MSLEDKNAVIKGYAPVNGLEMYYEVHGAGQPLVLVHGGFGNAGIFGELLTTLAASRQVIAVDLQGHGHTADIDRAFSYEQFGDDIAALIKHLGLGRADVLGYSLGGGVAFQTAIRHPEAVRKFIVVSAPCKREGWYPEVLAGMGAVNGEALIGSPMHTGYVSMAPDPNGFVTLANKTRQLLAQDYDWSKDVAALTPPALIVAADADSFAPAHAAEIFSLLGGGKRDAGWDGSQMPHSRLAILPGMTHYNSFASPLLPDFVTSFLDAPMPKPLQPEPQFVTKPAFTVVGLLLHTQPKASEIPQLWDQFIPRMGEIQHGIEPGVSYGLMDHFDQAKNTLDYMAGNPVADVAELPTGMNRWDVPANTYAVFETTLPKVGKTFDHIFTVWLPTSGYQQVTAPYFERYDETCTPEDPRISIYLPVEKR